MKIDKGVPLPILNSYPFKEMEIGDSFAVPYKDNKDAISRQSSILSASKRIQGRKFTTRKVRDKGEIRVWRIS